MMAFIDAHRADYGVEPICCQLPIAPSTYYEHKARQRDPECAPKRVKRDLRLKVDVWLLLPFASDSADRPTKSPVLRGFFVRPSFRGLEAIRSFSD